MLLFFRVVEYVSQRGNNYGVAGRNINNDASNTNDNIGAALNYPIIKWCNPLSVLNVRYDP